MCESFVDILLKTAVTDPEKIVLKADNDGWIVVLNEQEKHLKLDNRLDNVFVFPTLDSTFIIRDKIDPEMMDLYVHFDDEEKMNEVLDMQEEKLNELAEEEAQYCIRHGKHHKHRIV